MKKHQKAINNARTLLRGQEKALLSTHSVSKSGYPFGSVTTYMTDQQGHPVIYISHLAQHTRNIIADAKISLLVSSDHSHDINAGARLTLLGHAKPVDLQQEPDLSEQFYARFPDSRSYQNTHDFTFYRLHTEHVRYIGGFGQIHWLNTEDFVLPEPAWEQQVRPAITHMNKDHVDAMLLMLKHYHGIDADQAKMIHIYADGCVINANGSSNHYLPFDTPVEAPGDIRKRLVEMTHAARSHVA